MQVMMLWWLISVLVIGTNLVTVASFVFGSGFSARAIPAVLVVLISLTGYVALVYKTLSLPLAMPVRETDDHQALLDGSPATSRTHATVPA